MQIRIDKSFHALTCIHECKARNWYSNSVCPSVCDSHLSQCLSSKFSHRMVTQSF